MLERMEGDLKEHHSGQLRRESADVRAERIIAEELRREGWSDTELGERRKSDPFKVALTARLRRETTLTIGWIAARLKMGTRKSATTRLQQFKVKQPKGSTNNAQSLL